MARVKKEKPVLKNGKIPKRTVCPFRSKCPLALNGRCVHLGVHHKNPFSCAIARAYEAGVV